MNNVGSAPRFTGNKQGRLSGTVIQKRPQPLKPYV